MFRYKIKIKKVSGYLRESVLPKKNYILKSKTPKTKNQIFESISKHLNKKYNLTLIEANIQSEDPKMESLKRALDEFKNKPTYLIQYHPSLGARLWPGCVEPVPVKVSYREDGYLGFEFINGRPKGISSEEVSKLGPKMDKVTATNYGDHTIISYNAGRYNAMIVGEDFFDDYNVKDR